MYQYFAPYFSQFEIKMYPSLQNSAIILCTTYERANIMYSFDSRVRFSEVDHNCNMDLYTIINYFQDCSCFQSDDLGVGVKLATEIDCAWLLTSWQVVVNRYPTYGELITTGTWAYDFDSIYGYRNFIMKSSNNEVLAMANSNWIYVDLERKRPLKLKPAITDAYPIEPKLEDMEYRGRKISIPREYKEFDSFYVQQQLIDPNHHVNNGQYIKIAQQYLPDDFKIWQMRVEYKQQALFGDLIIPRVTATDQTYTIALVNKDAKPYCVVEFTTKEGLQQE